MRTTILIVDDHSIMRQGLKELLSNQPNMIVLGEAENGDDAVRLAREIRPQVVIMDVTMSGMNGIEATRRILAEVPQTKILALSMHSDRRFVSEMLKAGASAYVLKDGAFEELIEAMKTMMKNAIYLSPKITDVVAKEYVDLALKKEVTAFSLLTHREIEVLQGIAEGKTTKSLAFQFNLSVKTIETYRQQILKKLKLGSTAELTKYAIREGITSLE